MKLLFLFVINIAELGPTFMHECFEKSQTGTEGTVTEANEGTYIQHMRLIQIVQLFLLKA